VDVIALTELGHFINLGSGDFKRTSFLFTCLYPCHSLPIVAKVTL